MSYLADLLHAEVRVLDRVKTRKMGRDGYRSLTDFVVRHGTDFSKAKVLKLHRAIGMRRQCYKNALELVIRYPRLIYVEGFTTSGPIPIPHAWCLTRRGEIVEPTPRIDGDGVGYFGVPIKTRFAVKVVIGSGMYGVIDRPEDDWPIFKAKLSEWRLKL
jgi:hypothetical protein